MKAFIKLLPIYFLCSIISIFFSCQDAIEDSIFKEDIELISTRSITINDFDWENIDWMPTPSNQAKISPPWIGQGTLSSTYGLDVINDHKKSEGWVLLYNTFSSEASVLINPYFILYNKYRGLMRIYIYITTPFIASSTYIQDGISVISSKSTCLLSYLGEEIVDVAKNPHSYMQIQGAPSDESFPLASDKWYMLQYEIAYDSSLENTNYKDIQLSWAMNYYNVTKVSLGGDLVGKITGNIGSSSNTNIFSSLMSLGETSGTGVLAAIGSKILSDNKINSTGKNNLGLPEYVFNDVVSGVDKAISNSSSAIPKNIVNLLSAIIGGSNSGTTPISLNLEANITLNGTTTNGGSFPSSPTSFWVPGTIFTSSTQGYIPYYNKPLGVMYLSSKPHIKIKRTRISTEYEMPSGDPVSTGFEEIYEFPTNINYAKYLIINPEVQKIADIEILKQDLVTIHRVYKKGKCENLKNLNLKSLHIVSDMFKDHKDYLYQKIGIRFTIRVTPKDGSASSDIYKTFSLSEDFENTYYDYKSLVPSDYDPYHPHFLNK